MPTCDPPLFEIVLGLVIIFIIVASYINEYLLKKQIKYLTAINKDKDKVIAELEIENRQLGDQLDCYDERHY